MELDALVPRIVCCSPNERREESCNESNRSNTIASFLITCKSILLFRYSFLIVFLRVYRWDLKVMRDFLPRSSNHLHLLARKRRKTLSKFPVWFAFNDWNASRYENNLERLIQRLAENRRIVSELRVVTISRLNSYKSFRYFNYVIALYKYTNMGKRLNERKHAKKRSYTKEGFS